MSMAPQRGILYLIPNHLDQASLPEASLPASVIARARELRHYVVRGGKGGMAAAIPHPRRGRGRARHDGKARRAYSSRSPILSTRTSRPRRRHRPHLRGRHALCRRPGGALVALAHDSGYLVRPLVGPSSIILGLAASGLEGQTFSFLGYLPQDAGRRRSALEAIDRGIRGGRGPPGFSSRRRTATPVSSRTVSQSSRRARDYASRSRSAPLPSASSRRAWRNGGESHGGPARNLPSFSQGKSPDGPRLPSLSRSQDQELRQG